MSLVGISLVSGFSELSWPDSESNDRNTARDIRDFHVSPDELEPNGIWLGFCLAVAKKYRKV